MPFNLAYQFLKDLHNSIFCIFPVLQVFQAKSVYQVHVPGIQLTQYLQFPRIAKLLQEVIVLRPPSSAVRDLQLTLVFG